MTRKFKLFPAAGQLPRWIHALGSLLIPGCFRSAWEPGLGWAGLGKARLSCSQVAWLGLGQLEWKWLWDCAANLFLGWTVYPVVGGRSGGGRPCSKASCLSCLK